MDEKTYLMNGVPVSFVELIDEARKIDSQFSESKICTTSEAAQILRAAGYTLARNDAA